MKWQLTEPAFGDMIRVKSGSVYHYGIFAGEDEIIQFGLPPHVRTEVRDADVKVCTSGIDVFLSGNFVEVGVPDKGERKKRRSAEETVRSARARIGQGGYQIIHNNCEHFVYECYFGQKYSSQTDEVRKKFAALSEVGVYVAEIPDGLQPAHIYPPEREQEIAACKNERVRREKYAVWKLLQHALGASYGYDAEALQFFKSPGGKWKCDECELSLSHSGKAVAVALSRSPIGVDVEAVRPPLADSALQKVFSDEEIRLLHAAPESDRAALFTRMWTEKESIFKMLDKPDFFLSQPKSYNGKTTSRTLEICGVQYVVSIAHGTMQRVRFYDPVHLQ